MATNKRKVLDAARKYAQKGAKEKALREYHALLKLDGDGDAATHTCYLNLMSVEGGAKIVITGIYNDELAKKDGAWRFTRRKVSVDG